ncbi:hypothetical protein J2Z76_003053 [Sedimentibacter acidaminivorans]|uniref:Uncharacterized protein n=1 Tax=Sedimentibacter acidaminivorans TaxID=913099 RepID=A0ABS4GII8_9FIRM|nr:hypothetical protein [Sedimentibacter acidaminivorans]MBP1927180.1 hypothetical protein [Sedimentibacter acidaminivorans]
MKKYMIIIGSFIACFFGINILLMSLDIGLNISQYFPTQFNHIFVDSSRTFKITEYLELWVSLIGVLATAYLSYLLLTVSKKSNDISERLSDLEQKRDRQLIKSNAAIIYYQIIHSVNEMKLLYLKYVLNKKIRCNDSIKLHNEWISILGNLQDEFSLEETDLIYDFFIDVETINNSTDNEKRDLIENVFKKNLLPCYFDSPSMFKLERIDIITLFNEKMLSIILSLFITLKQDYINYDKINKKHILPDSLEKKYAFTAEMSNGRFNGNVKMMYNNLLIDAIFKNNHIEKGNVSAFYNNSYSPLYTVNYESVYNFNAKFYEITANRIEGNLIIDAEYVSSVFKKGYLKFYQYGELWDGIVEHIGNCFRMINGSKKGVLIEDSQKEYSYDAEQKYIEDQMERQNDIQYGENLANDESNIVGYRLFEDFIYEEGELIERINQRKEFIESDKT